MNKTEQVLRYARATLQPGVDHQLMLLDFIPVEERLPSRNRPGVLVLVGHSGQMPTEMYRAFRTEGGEWSPRLEGPACMGDGSEYRITHWAAIPKIAKEE